jgi:hypothetical protein
MHCGTEVDSFELRVFMKVPGDLAQKVGNMGVKCQGRNPVLRRAGRRILVVFRLS